MPFILSTDLRCDLTPTQLTASGIRYLSGVCIANGKIVAEPETTDLFDEVCARIRGGEKIERYALSTTDYEKYFDTLLEKNRGDVLHIACTEEDYAKALKASANEAIKFPRRAVFVVKSLLLSAGARLILKEADKMRESGITAMEAFVELTDLASKVKTLFIAKNTNKMVESGLISFGTLPTEVNSIYEISSADASVNHPFGKANLIGRRTGDKTAVKKVLSIIEESKAIGKIFVSGNADSLSTLMYDALLSSGFTVDYERAGLSTLFTFGADGIVVAFLTE